MPNWLKIYLGGVMMGAADVVPGVSGGTIAFILGLYDRLIQALSGVNKDSIKLLSKGDFKGLWAHFDGRFLLPLGLGILTSIFAIAGLIAHLLGTYPEYLWSFFFGLILASAFFLTSQIEGFSGRHLLLLLIGVGIGAAVSLIVPIQIDISNTMIFISGMIAICAMLLPGISGSFLLLMMGMYGFIIGAIKSLDLMVMAIFASGALLGLLSFSKLLNALLQHAKQTTLALLTGIMLGALVKVWPWKVTDAWVTVGDKKLPLEGHLILPWQSASYQTWENLLLPLIFVFAGFLSVLLISYISLRKTYK
ncbi:DUF368 domain-containing protein [Marinomonas pollencensis]|uniref:Putative membrane protein n=1 Tax=Marinomonas pollencensis TaxID=491954 RepID=A0A3E0DTG3_9GAMM|nr:DUF368 domain-containing protein [Marinomonas pollencensis]REG86859.1 putative membrane protein [Marinomonas pollencensis]